MPTDPTTADADAHGGEPGKLAAGDDPDAHRRTREHDLVRELGEATSRGAKPPDEDPSIQGVSPVSEL